VAAGPREVCQPPRVAKEVADPKEEGRELVLMYVALSLVEMEVIVCWILMVKEKEGDGVDDESNVGVCSSGNGGGFVVVRVKMVVVDREV